jgi:hypothetical protein
MAQPAGDAGRDAWALQHHHCFGF